MMFPESVTDRSTKSIIPALPYDALMAYPRLQNSENVIPMERPSLPLSHNPFLMRQLMGYEEEYSSQDISWNGMEQDDLQELLLARVTNVRTQQEQREAIFAARNAELNADLCELYDRFVSDKGPVLRTEMTCEKSPMQPTLTFGDEVAARSAVAQYINAQAAKGIVFSDATRVTAILSLCHEDDDPMIAAQAFRCGSMLILSLPSEEKIAHQCIQILLSSVGTEQEKAYRTGRTRKVDGWTLTYQQLFDHCFEVAPFMEPVSPETPFEIRTLTVEDASYHAAPYLLRDRITNTLCAWVREDRRESDLDELSTELQMCWEKREAEREFYRQESAWELMQWLTSEELTSQYSEEGHAILIEEVGKERAEAMHAAASTVAALFPVFLTPKYSY